MGQNSTFSVHPQITHFWLSGPPSSPQGGWGGPIWLPLNLIFMGQQLGPITSGGWKILLVFGFTVTRPILLNDKDDQVNQNWACNFSSHLHIKWLLQCNSDVIKGYPLCGTSVHYECPWALWLIWLALCMAHHHCHTLHHTLQHPNSELG